MLTENGSPVQYFMDFESDFVNVNQMLGCELSFTFSHYKCMNCKQEKRIFRQGYCYDCFTSIPQAGEWIMNPEKSTAHLGIEDRDLEYEKRVQLKPHIVYWPIVVT